MWANQDCTIRPVVGEVYEYLYVMCMKDYGFNQSYWNEQFRLITPDLEYPEDPYSMNLYIDWWSSDYNNPFTAGMVIECINGDPYPIEPDMLFSFDPL